ncbi:N-acetyltransferase GCN5 [Natrialba hulunbeirensis JCM 10989]|uniref:N-acetyltransferase GCN5 n=1 Tax=Natrialba hulunbeirensis JCM 10989 TaxID=1227493 RepID=L9ZP18_9EURY|nr:GNAT family N-acetyltransferase [Natrialba hulunbeirensis]ELY87806.1 N-acetyltransferase GCN5 [Natrialba hulunbeirensis JCM 10989]
MVPELTIEHATADDIDAVTDLWVQLAYGQREHDAAVRAEANREMMRETLAAHRVSDGLLVARLVVDGTDSDRDRDHDDDNETIAISSSIPTSTTRTTDTTSLIVGFASFSLEHGSLELDRTRGLLSNLYVVPSHRSQGIGSKLLAAVASELEDQGADALLLEVMARNDAAQEFYRSHGFEPYRLGMQRPLTGDGDDDSDDSQEPS